ncbi:hypothetical protein Ais01nite_15680 [Asanoa ishikariensis]|uniref:Uncharacterized protein n=1 Tax=Asanoa ishikariensis TaxID=137265 RepID=A0A1H3UI42_9ACTN|nr:hypothetical protein [Asanoa ishikariensis]GIF63533.1 hypothetical protein Ais01nite_15680 [Asanoa ishikariensis]SDZ61741.1 hypothetical protein SAMN05421684_7305 [Asanoa ishikariensis]
MSLEQRYRRLLVWYPWSHRRVYEEEMLAVLVAGARPGQRRPTLGETANLVASGLRYRAGAASSALTAPAWQDAAAVFGLLAALVLLSQRIARLLDPFGFDNAHLWIRAAGWAAVVLAIVVGRRLPAAALAWAAVVYEAVLVARSYETDPVGAVNLFWPVALGAVAAGALVLPAPHRHALTVLRLPRLAAFAGALTVLQAIPVYNHWQQRNTWYDLQSTQVYVAWGMEHSSDAVLTTLLAILALAVLTAGLAALTLPATVRWRLVVLAAPVVTLVATVKLTLSGWAYSNSWIGHPIYLVPIQWTLLVVVPLATLALGIALAQWRDQSVRLIALGRAADREG